MAEHVPAGDRQSQLLKLLRRVGQEEPESVGFGRPRHPAARHAPLALIAALGAASADQLDAAREAKADAAMVSIAAAETLTLPQTNGANWPIGVLAQHDGLVTPRELDGWTEAGADAIALRPGHALAACFSPKRQGLFAHLEQSRGIDGLRAAILLPVAGYMLEIPGQGERLTGDDLLWLGTACGMLRGPVVLLSARVTGEDLEALVGSGISGVALSFPHATDAKAVGRQLVELRAGVDGLDPHLRQAARDRSSKAPVVIPFRGTQD